MSSINVQSLGIPYWAWGHRCCRRCCYRSWCQWCRCPCDWRTWSCCTWSLQSQIHHSSPCFQVSIYVMLCLLYLWHLKGRIPPPKMNYYSIIIAVAFTNIRKRTPVFTIWYNFHWVEIRQWKFQMFLLIVLWESYRWVT